MGPAFSSLLFNMWFMHQQLASSRSLLEIKKLSVHPRAPESESKFLIRSPGTMCTLQSEEQHAHQSGEPGPDISEVFRFFIKKS